VNTSNRTTEQCGAEVTHPRIFKYQLPVQEKFTLELPVDARIIRVDDIDGLFWLWAIVQPGPPYETRRFECYKTGQPIETPPDHLTYLGLCKLFIMQELGLYIFENVGP
jgi:hypothetical protein